MTRSVWFVMGCLILALLTGGMTMPLYGHAQGSDGLWTNYTLDFRTNALAVQGNTLWVGTSGGLLRWNLSQDSYVKYTPADGLADTQVNDVAVDSQGRVWVAHERGLSVFDGSTWTTYDKTNSGIPGDVVYQVVIADDGRAWLISRPVASDEGLGVTVFDGTTWTTYDEHNSGLSDDAVTSMAFDRNGHLWVGTTAGNVFAFDGVNWTIYPDPTYNSYAITVIGVDNAGRMWFHSYWTASNPAVVLMFDGATWTRYTPENGCNDWVRGGALDEAGQLWLSTWAGLCSFDGATWTRYHAENSGLLSDWVGVMEVDGQNVWLGYGDGSGVQPVTVTQFDGEGWSHYQKPEILPRGLGSGIAVDRQGRKWFGLGSPGGVGVFDDKTWTTYDSSNSGLLAACTTIIRVDRVGHLWFAGGNCGGGLVEFDGVTWTQHYGGEGLPDYLVQAVAVGQDNRIWAGSRLGLSVFDGTNWTTYNTSNSGLPTNSVESAVIDGAGNAWVGCTTRFDGVSWVTYASVEEAIETHYVDIVDTVQPGAHCWVADGATGRVWRAAGTAGVSVYDGATWSTFSPSDMGFSATWGRYPSPLGLDHFGNLWVVASDSAPHYGGVSRFDGSTWTVFRQVDGLLEPPVHDMAADLQGHVWFMAWNGVSEFFDPWQPTQVTVGPSSGGSLTSADGSTAVILPAGAVTTDTVVTYTPTQPAATAGLVGIAHFFDLTAVISGTTTPVTTFQLPYTITVDYTDAEKGAAIESTLGLYWWNGNQWLQEPTNRLDAANNRLTATPDHMTLFAVLGETTRVYLPLLLRDR